MALRPPDDFAPAAPERAEPGEAELRALWRRHEDARAERERLVFAEGRADGAALLPAPGVDEALARLCAALADLGIAAAPERCAGLRRLDVAADLRTDSAVEGLALLECVAAASFGAGKLAAYRAERRVESVLIKSRAGRTLAGYLLLGAAGVPQGARRTTYELERESRELGVGVAQSPQQLVEGRHLSRASPLRPS